MKKTSLIILSLALNIFLGIQAHANGGLTVLRTINEVAQIARVSVEAEAVAAQIFSLAASNGLNGIRLTAEEISSIKALSSYSEEGALVRALGEKRAEEFLQSVKATIYLQNTLLLTSKQSSRLKEVLELEQSFSAKLSEEISQSGESVSSAFASKKTGFSLSVNKHVAETTAQLPLTQANRLFGHVKSMGTHAKLYPNLRPDLTSIAKTRVSIAKSLNSKIGKPVPYSATSNRNGVCDVTEIGSMKNIARIDEQFLNQVKGKNSLTVEEAQSIYDVVFAENLTNGNTQMGEALQKEIQCGGCPDKSAIITGVNCLL